VIGKHIAHTKPKVGVGVLHMLVDDPHMMIFRIVLVINRTREALFSSRNSEFSSLH
jgi:hypothetical protein